MCYLLPSWKLPCLPRSFSLPCLPRSFTTSALHHPNVLDLPFLSDLRSKAKLTLLISIPTSNDPFIEEITSIHKDESYCASQKIPRVCIDLLHKARLLVSSFTTKSINIYCRHELSQKMNCGETKRNWNLCQSTELEDVNNMWKRITHAVPSSRSAFIPAESRHRHMHCQHHWTWNIGVYERIPVVLVVVSQPTVRHSLSNCPVSLQPDRYSWRHDCALYTSPCMAHVDNTTLVGWYLGMTRI